MANGVPVVLVERAAFVQPEPGDYQLMSEPEKKPKLRNMSGLPSTSTSYHSLKRSDPRLNGLKILLGLALNRVSFLPGVPALRRRLKGGGFVADRQRQRFYCAALAGKDDYNICINSDLTVSCNCDDKTGEGQIGNLRTNTLEEIFSGPTAYRFRRELAEGEFPLSNCQSCSGLRQANDKREAFYHVHHHQMPKNGIMVENTVSCNLTCCDRGVEGIRNGKALGPQGIEFVAGLLAEHDIKKMSYFNLGEPFFSKSIYEELSTIKEANPDIKIEISTNGTLLEGERKQRAALLCDLIVFSINGSNQKIAELYQGKTDFARAYRNLRQLVELRDSEGRRTPIIKWKYVVFSWNQDEEYVQGAIELATQAKADILEFVRGGHADRKSRSTIFDSAPHFKRIPLADGSRNRVLKPRETESLV